MPLADDVSAGMDSFFSGLTKIGETFSSTGSDMAMKFAGNDGMWTIFVAAVSLELAMITYRALTDAGSWVQEVVELAMIGILVTGSVGAWGEVRDIVKKGDTYVGTILGTGADTGLTTAAIGLVSDAIGPIMNASVGNKTAGQSILDIFTGGEYSKAKSAGSPATSGGTTAAPAPAPASAGGGATP